MAYKNYSNSNGWVVSKKGDGDFSTITAALAAATTASYAGSIYIREGTYTEDLTLVTGVNLISEMPGSVVIIGKTSALSVTMCVSGITFQTNSDYCIYSQGSILTLNNCVINCSNNIGVYIRSPQVNFYFCTLIANYAIFTTAFTAIANFYFCNFTNPSNVTATTIIQSNVFFYFCKINVQLTTGSGINLNASHCVFSTSAMNIPCVVVTATPTQVVSLYFCSLSSGSAACATVSGGPCTLNLIGCTLSSSNTNVIAGTSTGTLNYNTCFSDQSYKTTVYTQSGSYELSSVLALNGTTISTGSGAPAFTAPRGSMYLNTTASTANTRAYVNTTGSTTWTNFNAAG
jgi:hypothetical protein